MVFTLRWTLGVYLVFLALSQAQSGLIINRNAREVTESQVPSSDLLPSVTSTEKQDESTTKEIIKTEIINHTSTPYFLDNKTDSSEPLNVTLPTRPQGRSLDFDISKYTSPEFHNKNNVYSLPTSPENEAFITPETTDSEHFHTSSKIATPSSEFFDAKYDEIENKVKQDLDETDHFFDEHAIEDHSQRDINDYLELAKKNNTNSKLDLLRYTSVTKDDKDEKNSVNKNYESEERLKINFDTVYNESKSYDEVSISTITPSPKPTAPTKFPPVNKTTEHNSLLSNKIEAETIKPVDDRANLDPIKEISPQENLITVTKRGSADPDNFTATTASVKKEYEATVAAAKRKASEAKEQSIEENNIYSVLAPAPLTTVSSTSVATEPATVAPEPTTVAPKSSSVRPEYTTTPPKPTAAPPELTSMATEPTTVAPERITAATEPATIATEPASMATESASMVTEPTSLATEPASMATEPTTVATESTTVATEPATVATAETSIVAMYEMTEENTKDEITSTQNVKEARELVTEETFYEMTEESASTPTSTTDATEPTESNESTEYSVTEYSENTTEFPLNEEASTERLNYTTEAVTTEEITTPVETTTQEAAKSLATTTEAHVLHPYIDEETDEEYTDIHNEKVNTEDFDIIEEEKAKTTTTTVTSTTSPTTTTPVPEERKVHPETTTVKVREAGSQEDEDEEENAPHDGGASLGSDPVASDGTILAIVLSTVGVICLVLLAVLLFIMRRRSKRFTYGQRCTPVSLDTYSMDNVSNYNSVRRKTTVRDSKRSYGNPAFDDTNVSHTLNFPGLTRFATNTEAISSEFNEIPQVTARATELPDGCDLKNRYANIIPLPETRVILSSQEDDSTSHYINANYVTGPKGVRGYYVACQAPMSNTVNDFWRMVWEQQSKVILMLTHLYENGVEKCIDYLPPSEVLDCHRLFGDYQVTLKEREVKDKYIISSLQLKNMVTNSWREVTHFWYSGWPEKGVPNEENSIIAFLIEARSHVKLVQNNTEVKPNKISNGLANGDVSPVIVHCSPGTGRTGTVIACDIAIREFELKRVVDIPRIVYKIRRDRASSVQTKDQYSFIYKVINLYATKLTGGALDSI